MERTDASRENETAEEMTRKKIGGVRRPPSTPREVAESRVMDSVNRIVQEIHRAAGINSDPFDDAPDSDRQADIFQDGPQ